ncbi:MAG: hypothetical protein EA399_00155 [Desulfovibrionales bacterium]|nr:MAG: hypothetical protein EA399_00155 [Desulfovibrionales bacterium]
MQAHSVCLPIIDLLKELPEDALRAIFWEVFTDFEDSALDDEERNDLRLANDDWEKGETIEWNALR